MAIMTFELQHGLKAGDQVHHEVGLRELTSGDVIDAQLTSEKVALVEGKAMAYTSEVLMGFELLRRQVEYVGSYKGPLSIKDLRKLKPSDLEHLQEKAQELDALLIEEIAKRGRS